MPRFGHQPAQVERAFVAGRDADHDDRSPGRQRLHAGRQVGSADQLEDDVEGAVLVGLVGGERAVGAQLLDRGAVLLVAHRGGHVGAERAAELHRGGADAAPGAVHEQPLPAAKFRLPDERVISGREDLREAARLRPVERIGDRHQLPLLDHRVLRLRATGDDRHHPRAGLEPRHRRARLDHLARQLHPRDVIRHARLGRRRIEPRHLHRVGPVDARRANADQHLAETGRRVFPGPRANRFVLDLGNSHPPILPDPADARSPVTLNPCPKRPPPRLSPAAWSTTSRPTSKPSSPPRHRPRRLARHHPPGPQRVHLLGRGRQTAGHPRAPHPPHPRRARGRHAPPLLLAGLQAPGAQRAVGAARRGRAARF